MIWGLPVVEAMRDNIGAKKLWFLVPFYCKGTRFKPNIYQDRLGTKHREDCLGKGALSRRGNAACDHGARAG
jgi:hypothetical protein|eukprot:COSAG06_NODE_2582_length_6617_cov_1892.613037_2_plen_72_part_00